MHKLSYFFKFLLLILPMFACSGSQAFRVQTNTDYTIGPGDVVRIELKNYRGYNEKLFVDFSGIIKTKAIGEILVTGFTLNDLEITIAGKYSQVLTKPRVHVDILSRAQQAIYIAGKIKKPGIVRYNQSLTVAESIHLAGGIKNLGREYSVYVLRKKTDGRWAKFKIKLKRTRGSSEVNNGAFKLSPYDIVYVTKLTEMEASDLTYNHKFGTEI